MSDSGTNWVGYMDIVLKMFLSTPSISTTTALLLHNFSTFVLYH